MAALAVTGQPLFKVEPIEKELPPPSYTAETLAELRRRHPADEFALVVGADSLADLPGWYEPRRVLEQAEVVAVPRPGVETWTADRLAAAVGLPREAVRLTIVDCPLIEVASRDLRRRVAEGKSIRFLVPRAVEEYVRDKALYRE
jgi:nicotinate-nucleotide adenylyltransferase